MTPTDDTRTYYRKAMGLSACARTFVSLGKWIDAARSVDKAQEYWLLVRWQQ